VLKPYVLWPALSGTVFLVFGLVLIVRRAWATASGLDRLVVLGPAFVAAPLATFGADHLILAPLVARMIPPWIPLHLFWAYFVGVALLAAAVSLVLGKHVRLSSTLLGVMFVLFVLSMHLPNAVANPGDRFAWAVALRDLAFGGGALAFAATDTEAWRARGTSRLAALGRVMVAVPVLFFAIEHFLHPEFAPGVPLQKLTPAWIPAPSLWGYSTGAVLLAAAGAVLVDRHARAAATALGFWVVLLTAFLYVPILAAAGQSSEMVEGLNYVGDTMLFGGTVLLLAAAMPGREAPWPRPTPAPAG
jgi:uncharacterized membrane protein